MNKFSDFIRSKIDYLKTLLWNLFAPNMYKLLYQRYMELRDALDERVMAAITRKDATQKGLLDALKSYIKEELT